MSRLINKIGQLHFAMISSFIVSLLTFGAHTLPLLAPAMPLALPLSSIATALLASHVFSQRAVADNANASTITHTITMPTHEAANLLDMATKVASALAPTAAQKDISLVGDIAQQIAS